MKHTIVFLIAVCLLLGCAEFHPHLKDIGQAWDNTTIETAPDGSTRFVKQKCKVCNHSKNHCHCTWCLKHKRYECGYCDWRKHNIHDVVVHHATCPSIRHYKGRLVVRYPDKCNCP